MLIPIWQASPPFNLLAFLLYKQAVAYGVATDQRRAPRAKAA